MNGWSPERVAAAAGARIAPGPWTLPDGGPSGATPDVEEAAGRLFVGLPGRDVDGGRRAGAALRGGAWGALVRPDHAAAALDHGGPVLVSDDPLLAVRRLAAAWRRASGAAVLVVIGPESATTAAAGLAGAMAASAAPTTVEPWLGELQAALPFAVLRIPGGVRVAVLAASDDADVSMLGELAQPDIGLVTGSVDAGAERLASQLRAGGTMIVPTGTALPAPAERHGVRWITFGPGGSVAPTMLPAVLGFSDAAPETQQTACAALACVRAAGLEPRGPLSGAAAGDVDAPAPTASAPADPATGRTPPR